MAGQDVGYYTLPVILSMEGVDKQVNSKLGKAFEGFGKKAGKQLGDGMKTAAADVDKLALSYTKLKDRAADSLGKVRTDEAALKRLRDTDASSDKIIRAEERLATSRRNSSRANREAEDSHKSLLVAQRSLSDGTDGLGRKFGGLSDIAGTAGKALTMAGVVAAGAAVVGIGALVVGVAAAGRALYELGAEFDDVFDNIRIKTGATGPALQQLEKATERLSTKVPLSIGEIGNVVAETSRALHLTGPELDNVARSVANLGRLTGENVDVRLLGKAFRGFGVDAKDQVPALDALFRASQATGVGVNELLATVVKGGAGLRQFGFDFGQSAALATQFEESGLDADKAMAGLTKGLATLAKDGQTGQQALRDNVTGIKNLLAAGKDAEALDLTNKLFGAKGGVQFFDAIKNGALDLDTLADSISNTGDTIDQAAKDTDDWSERWQTFKNQLKVGLQPIATGVFDTINDKLTQLADWVSGHQDEVIRFFGRVGDAALVGAQGVLTFTSQSLRALAEFIKGFDQSFGPVFDAFSKAGNVLQFTPGFQDIGRAMKTIGDAGGSINDVFAKAPDLLNKGADAVDNLANKLPGVKSAWDEIIDRTAKAQQFTQAIGDATASVPDGKTIELSANTPEVIEGLKQLGIQVTTLPDGKIGVTATTEEARRIIDAFIAQQTNAPLKLPVSANLTQARFDVDQFMKSIATGQPVGIPVAAAPGTPGAPTPQNPFAGPYPRRAFGGPITGGGGPKSDIIPIWASNGEHMLPTDEVNMMGGQAGVYRFRSALRAGMFAGGGALDFRKLGAIIWPPEPVGPSDKTRPGGVPALDPGRSPNQIGLPDWGTPGQAFGPPPPGWFDKPVNPDDVLFPDYQPPWIQDWMKKHGKRIKPLGFAGGGAIGDSGIQNLYAVAQDLVGTPYQMGGHTKTNVDCSGAASILVNAALGLNPYGDRMDTKSAPSWLKSKGAVLGTGPAGTLRVGWYNGGPGGGHMAVTLPDGRHAEAGGAVGDIFEIGNGAAGADDPEFTDHAFFPVNAMFPDGLGYGTGAVSPLGTGGGGGGGGGTPGVGPNGEAGTFTVDQNDVADAQGRVAEADARVREAEAKKNELDKDAKESEKIAADNDVNKAKADADKARRELGDAQRGKFTATGKGGAGGGDNPLKEILGIVGGGLKETFGIGDWLPDIADFPAVKAAETLLGTAIPMATAYANGEWQPGGLLGDALGTSSAPFGIPDVAVPPMPPPGVHEGSGMAPGPGGGTTVIDQSIHGNVGWDPAQTMKTRDEGLKRAIPRIKPGA